MNEQQVANRVETWFDHAWDSELSLREWRTRLLDSGWAVPSWSKLWFGQQLPGWTDAVAHDTIRRAGGVAVPIGVGVALAAPTIYEHGSDDLKHQFLRPTLTGELDWCQLFSEPGAGSDLAGLQATAVRDGDQWIVNGQKVWNTSADHADMAILIARTDWDAPKHAGLTYFALDMHQPGVEVRPIEQMNFHNSFNEVFLDNAIVSHQNVVGNVGEGWRVARATLAHERSFSMMRNVFFRSGVTGRVVDEAKAEAESHLKTYEWYPQRKGRFDLVMDRARSAENSDDQAMRKVVQDRAMQTWMFEKAAALTADRAAIQRALGKPPGPEGSIGKLSLSELARRCNDLHTTMGGALAMLDGSEGDDEHRAVAETLISTPAQSIAGGTDEVQKNIVGERMLGLPKEPTTDRGVPFRNIGRPKQSSTSDAIRVTVHDDHVATIEICRPPNNFFSMEVIGGIADALAQCDKDETVRAAVLCAQGKHFCAGADFSGGGSSYSTEELYAAAARIFDADTPTVATIQGAAVGGGLGLALSSDFRFGTSETRMSANFARLGFHHGFGLSVTLPRLVGTQVAADMLYTGRRIKGEEAASIGLLDRLVSIDGLRDDAHKFAREIATSAPLAVRSIRRTLRGDLANAVRAATAHENTEQTRLRQTEDFVEGSSAMAERRAPRFRGK